MCIRDRVKADYPKALLKGSPVSASIAAAIMNGKYVNAFPLYRLEKEFERYGDVYKRQILFLFLKSVNVILIAMVSISKAE